MISCYHSGGGLADVEQLGHYAAAQSSVIAARLNAIRIHERQRGLK
jgi:hypothetical protein